MLLSVSRDGLLTWRCVVKNVWGELVSCGQIRQCPIEETTYVALDPPRGATIRLPPCPCGAQLFLKADYSLTELAHALVYIEESEEAAYVLPLRYVYNLALHQMLYEQGRADVPPVLEMPPVELLEHPAFAGVKPETMLALWYGFAVARAQPLLLKEGS